MRFLLVVSVFAVSAPLFARVFLPDQRTPIVDTGQYPWSTLGFIRSDKGGGSVGVLIGPDVVLTSPAAIDPATGKLRASMTTFDLGYFAGGRKLKANITHWYAGMRNSRDPLSSRWVLLRISQQLGDEVGYLGVGWVALPHVHSLTYSGKTREGMPIPEVHFNCSVRDKNDGVLLHDCDTSHAHGDGPLLIFTGEKETYVVGWTIGAYGKFSRTLTEPYSSEKANIAVPSTSFIPTLKKLLPK